MDTIARYNRQPWNKGKLVGQKTPLRVRDIWAIRVRLQLAERTRDLALFNLAIDSKLRACDLTKLRVRDIAHGDHVSVGADAILTKGGCGQKLGLVMPRSPGFHDTQWD
jgi:hypothetical protein